MRKVFLEYLPKKKNGRVDWVKVSNQFVHFIYDDIEGDLKIVKCEEVIKSNKKRYILTIKYKDYDLFEMNIDTLIKGSLGNLLKRNTPDFKIGIGETFKDDKRDLIITNRIIKVRYKKDGSKCNDKYYKYKCLKCGFECGEHYKNGEYKEELWIEESNLLHHEKGCGCCCPTPRVIVAGINDIPTTIPWMVKYFQGGYDEAKKYTKGSGSKIYPVCPDCGRVKDKPVYISSIYGEHSIGCICGDGKSFCEKMMYNILEQLHIDFKAEYSPKWCRYKLNKKVKQGRYDFYIPSMNLIIEMDGGWHNNDNTMNGQTKEESKEIDGCKDKKANKKDLEVIRVDCDYEHNDRFEYIKNNIISKLSDELKLSKVDWIKVEQYCEKNLVKEVCKMWKKFDGRINTGDISKTIGLNRSTIVEYLKKGAKLGWVNYNPKEELRKGRSKNGKSNGKSVKILKNGIELGRYPSCSELERCSEKDFGIKLGNGAISSVCNNKLKQYKGFTFKYIEENETTGLHNQELVQAS